MIGDECFFSGCCDEVFCSEKETWIQLSELKKKTNKSRTFSHAENLLEVILLKADMFFQHKFDVENAFVCDAHHKILLRQVYFYKSRSKCDTCSSVRKTASHVKTDLRNITVCQAITLFESFNLRNSYGKLICRDCRTEVSKKTEVTKEELHNDAFECLFDPESVCCKEDSMENDDLDYQLPHDPSTDVEKLNQQLAALNSFLAACGSKRKVNVTASYENLSRRVKLRYVGLAKFIIQSATSLMTTNDPYMLMHDVFSDMNSGEPNVVLDGNFRQIMSGVSEAYSNAESWQSRREILSIVAPKISLKLMQLFIPGLTSYRFSAARLHAMKYGVGSRVETTAKVVQRFDDYQIAHFVDFIVSPHVCTDLPFGEKVLKLSSGVELFIPNTIRNMGATRIIDQYFHYCSEMCSDFEPLGKSSLFTILETCKASTRKSLQGINYFAAEAGEAFDGIKKMIEEKVAVCSDSDRFIENLKRARFYLKSDYKVHVTRSSNIADHCCIYALSDPEKRDFAQACDHEHDESCVECSNLTSTLNEIERFIEETEKDEGLLDRALKKFRSYRDSIVSWKAHLLRSINQHLCRENLLDELSNDEIYLNLDWAMKFLPVKSREPQSDFFGKRGISWHISVVMKNDASVISKDDTFDEDNDISDDSQGTSEHELADTSEENEDGDSVIQKKKKHSFSYKVFVHVFDQCTQDSETVVTILNDVLCRVKETDPQIEKAFIRSDNAGCYHSANTLVSAKKISEKTGIAIERIDFCDPQGGKGPCDRYAAVIKSNVRRYLNENHNVTSASEFVEACHSYKGVKGVFVLNCRIENDKYKENRKCTIKQIKNYFNFEYQSKGLLVHRSWDVGSGLLIPWSQLKRDKDILLLTARCIEGFTHEWAETKERHRDEIMDVDDCDVLGGQSLQTCDKQTSIYECDVEPGCTAEFVKFGNYLNHILIGKHRRLVEKLSLKDTAMKMYHSKLEEVENRRIISIDMNLVDLIDDETIPLPKGWALPTRKSNTEFSDKQKEYLQKKFDEGVSGVKHWKPKEVVLDMETLTQDKEFYFSASEILNESQVRSFFSRLKRENQINTPQQTPTEKVRVKGKTVRSFDDENDDEEIDSDQDEYEDDFQDTEAAVEEMKTIENICASAKRALTESSSHRMNLK